MFEGRGFKAQAMIADDKLGAGIASVLWREHCLVSPRRVNIDRVDVEPTIQGVLTRGPWRDR